MSWTTCSICGVAYPAGYPHACNVQATTLPDMPPIHFGECRPMGQASAVCTSAINSKNHIVIGNPKAVTCLRCLTWLKNAQKAKSAPPAPEVAPPPAYSPQVADSAPQRTELDRLGEVARNIWVRHDAKAHNWREDCYTPWNRMSDKQVWLDIASAIVMATTRAAASCVQQDSEWGGGNNG